MDAPDLPAEVVTALRPAVGVGCHPGHSGAPLRVSRDTAQGGCGNLFFGSYVFGVRVRRRSGRDRAGRPVHRLAADGPSNPVPNHVMGVVVRVF